MSSEHFPDELNYETNSEANVAIIKAMGEIRFMQRMEQLMPLVARELVRAGVDFSKVEGSFIMSSKPSKAERVSVTAGEMKKFKESPQDDRIQRRFLKFHADNPHIYRLLVKYTRDAVLAREERGMSRAYGIAAVVERVRWHVNVEAQGAEEFKLPNDFRARYARLIMAQEQDLLGVFELRSLRTPALHSEGEAATERD